MRGRGFVDAVRLRRELVADFDRYPFDIPAVRGIDELALDPRVTFLIGENGSGKSTLIEAIATVIGFNPEGGTRNFHFAYRPSESDLHKCLRPVRSARRPARDYFLRAESFFNVASVAENELYPGWARLHERSHGEAFPWLLKDKFGPNGLYVLDEPEAALSPGRQLAMLSRMHALVIAGSQFIIATHSPILMAYPGATLYELNQDGIRVVAYQDTEHYRVTRDFLQQPDRFLRHLLGAADPAPGNGDPE